MIQEHEAIKARNVTRCYDFAFVSVLQIIALLAVEYLNAVGPPYLKARDASPLEDVPGNSYDNFSPDKLNRHRRERTSQLADPTGKILVNPLASRRVFQILLR